MSSIESRYENQLYDIVSVEHDIELYNGDSRLIVVRVKDRDTGEIIDLTGASLQFAVGDSYTNPVYKDLLIDRSNSTELYVHDGPDGVVVLKITQLDTINLVPRDYSYALSYGKSGEAHTIIAGRLKVRRSVGKLSGKLFFHKQNFTADGSTFLFELEAAPEPQSAMVLSGAVPQTEGTDYTIVGTTLQFLVEPPDADTLVEVSFPSLTP